MTYQPLRDDPPAGVLRAAGKAAFLAAHPNDQWEKLRPHQQSVWTQSVTPAAHAVWHAARPASAPQRSIGCTFCIDVPCVPTAADRCRQYPIVVVYGWSACVCHADQLTWADAQLPRTALVNRLSRNPTVTNGDADA